MDLWIESLRSGKLTLWSASLTSGISIKIKNANSKALIVDIIMEPEMTKLLKEAKLLKYEIHLGKHMLNYQEDLMENILTKQILWCLRS